MITIENLTFEYPGVRALDDVSLEIQKGDITALVGPNGAGKTTLMRCIAALETPITGTIMLGDLNVLEQPRLCHKKIGYLADFFGLYEALTVRQCLTYFARAQLIEKENVKTAVQKAAHRLKIEDRLEQNAGALSRGLAQRLAIAQAIIHEPEFIILDEPASGLDPGARHSLSQLFLELKTLGMTLLISSHILSELEEYSDHMIIVQDGKIIQHTDVKKSNEDKIVIKIQTSKLHTNLSALLQQYEGVSDVTVADTQASLRFANDSEQQAKLLHYLISEHVSVCSFTREKHTLQQAYMAQIEQIKIENDNVK